MIESESGDRSQQPPGPGRGSSSTIRDEFSALRGKAVGDCAGCGKPVYFEQYFTRFRGRVVHLRCPISAHTTAAIPNFVKDALAPRATSREQ